MAKRKTKKKHAVVFDFDGTLTNVRDALVKLVDQGAMPKKAQRELDELRAKYFTPTMAGELTPEQQKHWLAGTFGIYVRHGLTLPEAYKAIDHVDLRHGVRDCLARLQDAGIPVAIVSYGVRQFIKRVLARQGLIDGSFDAICAADLLVEPITRTVLGYREDTLVIPENKGEWSRRFADAHGVPHENLLAVGDTRGDGKLGHLKANRLGLAASDEDAEKLMSCMSEVHVGADFHTVTEWLFRKMGPR